MQSIIKIKSASYKRYEELISKKEKLLKEADKYKRLYESVFDSLLKEVYEARIDCVKKRKVISYCKSSLSQHIPLIQKNIDEFIDKAMSEYKETLDYLNETPKQENDNKNVLQNSEEEQKKIKDTYHQLAKLIHPDMNADLKDDPIILDLWNRMVIAYNCQNLQELEELSILINNYLESIHHKHLDVEIPDINEKIFNLNREIYRIVHTNPYQYKYIMENEEEVKRKIEEYSKELSDYQRYSEELDKEIETFDYLIQED